MITQRLWQKYDIVATLENIADFNGCSIKHPLPNIYNFVNWPTRRGRTCALETPFLGERERERENRKREREDGRIDR